MNSRYVSPVDSGICQPNTQPTWIYTSGVPSFGCPQHTASSASTTIMSLFLVHDTVSLDRTKRRSSFLTCRRRPDAAPIPPTLVNSPYLSSPNSVFRRKTSVPKWPSQEEDEWLRDMVPVDGSLASDVDTKSEGSNDLTPSPTSSDSSYGCSLFPPSPMLRPRSTSPDVAARRARCGSGSGQSPHS